jgi:hypothetical protein
VALAIDADDRHSKRATLPIARFRDLLIGRVNELHAMEAARLEVERRHLDGVGALFPSGQREWEIQRTNSERQAVLTMRLAEFDGAAPPPDDDPAAIKGSRRPARRRSR